MTYASVIKLSFGHFLDSDKQRVKIKQHFSKCLVTYPQTLSHEKYKQIKKTLYYGRSHKETVPYF